MMYYVTTLPIWLSGAAVIGLATLLGMASPIWVRRRVTLERLRINNEVAGFKFATVGVLYAVLLAFAIIVVWEKFSDAENAASQEAGAIATLFRLSEGVGGAAGTAFHESVAAYARSAMTADWPAMEHGEVSGSTTRALDGAYSALLAFSPADRRGDAVFAESLHQLDIVTQARRARLVMATGAVPGVLWFVLLAGGVVTIGFTLFFGAENLRVQAVMTGIIAFLIFAGLFVVVAIDRPFTGQVKVGPEALSRVLEYFGSDLPSPQSHLPSG